MKNFKFLSILFIVFIFTYCSTEKDDNTPLVVTPKTALRAYLENGDTTYNWTIKSTYSVGSVSAYDIRLTSQKWREHTWVHQLTIFVPATIQYNGALLWITGGSINNGEPNWTGQSDGENMAFALIAMKNDALVTVLRQTPNQPLYNDLTEVTLISYTLYQYLNDGDYSWPLLFPMTKSAIRAMDAVQEFAQSELQQQIDEFLVSGASKRGWTTWLTGAHDSRVVAIAPAVIDMLNMPVSINYHLEAWGAFSPQIQDYVDLGITDELSGQNGGDIATMIDPYSYKEKLTMPKLILLGTNDPYWPVDVVKHYIDEIPGQNYIHNTPNAGHGLNGGEQALYALSAFWASTLQNTPYTECSWDITENNNEITIKVQASGNQLNKALLWVAESDDRDFRDAYWTSSEIDFDANGIVNEVINYPDSGFKAFYIDLGYTDTNGDDYTKSTRVFVTDSFSIL
ncbi:MAG: PhoPQ-activated pathogenicity-like protein PqaA type [Bacteroidetes bacterium]|nr:MAG: PhoPQ-activated pathogenicity-like protein PqaA type [Bacteroidota bacterium]